MPSTYAHYRLGQEVEAALPDRIKAIIGNHQELYHIGLHGPDILFYYKPLFPNAVNQTGYGLHDEPARDFFSQSGKIILKSGEREAYLAYIYGFICHFVLDSECHGYIDEKIRRSGISHTEIEVEFDRNLLCRDGYNPLNHSLTEHIIPSDRNAAVIAEFFPGITETEVKYALESMKKYNKLLLAPHLGKRLFLYGLLAVTGNYKEMHGLIVNYRPNPNCEDSTEKLKRLYVTAVRESVRLIGEYEDYLKRIKPLDARYRLTFGSKEVSGAREKVLA